ncbi:hypothetical protein [Novosphingopyxis sp.]|uniref:hypothetical protein n=1 Tax=Novosphingopyxis sp. TaxID=2709690 RepID=UPI003B5CFD2A
MILALLLAASTPEAQELGERLARTGTLASLAPLLLEKDTEELIAEQPDLTADEQAELRTIAKATGARLLERVTSVEGAAYAEQLSVVDLRALVMFAQSEVAKRQRAVTPAVIVQTMTAMGEIDFKSEVAEAMCSASGKLCDR